MWGCYIQLPFCPSSKSCWEALLKDANIHPSHSHCVILKGAFLSQDLKNKKSRLSGLRSWGASRSPCHPEQLKNTTNSLFFQEKAAAFLAHWGSFHYHRVSSVIKMYQPVPLSGWQWGDAGGICFWSLASAGALSQGWGLEAKVCSVVSLKLSTRTFACSHCLQCSMTLSKWKIAAVLLGGDNLPCLLLPLMRCWETRKKIILWSWWKKKIYIAVGMISALLIPSLKN